jgi:ATP synthase protein I
LVFITGALCGVVGGVPAALSALLGGVSCAVPNAWFARRLSAAAHRPGGASVTDFFTGEALKVALTLMLMFLAVKLYAALVWPAFIAGLVVALKSYWFGLLLKKYL